MLNSWNGKWNVIAGSKERIKHLKTENREPKENQHLKVDKRISKRKRSELCSVICLLRNKYFIMQRLIEDFICFTLSKSVAVAYKSLVNRWCFFVKHKPRKDKEMNWFVHLIIIHKSSNISIHKSSNIRTQSHTSNKFNKERVVSNMTTCITHQSWTFICGTILSDHLIPIFIYNLQLPLPLQLLRI